VGNFASNTTHTFLGSPTAVALTGPIQVTGVYYINATSFVVADLADSAIFCYVTTVNDGFFDGIYSGTSVLGQFQAVAIADEWFIAAGDRAELVCYSNNSDANSYAYNSSLSATLINSAFDPQKAKHSQPVNSNTPPALK
jgi:hypothetical protein